MEFRSVLKFQDDLTLILIVTAFILFCGEMMDISHNGGMIVLKHVVSTSKEFS
jgi:hypothetical protein